MTEANLALVHIAPAGAAPPQPEAEQAPQTAGVTLPEMERRSLEHALQRSGGNVSRAARELGISRDTMRYRMAKHCLTGD